MGLSPSARSAGPRISVDDRPDTSGTACSLSDVDSEFDKGDKESSQGGVLLSLFRR